MEDPQTLVLGGDPGDVLMVCTLTVAGYRSLSDQPLITKALASPDERENEDPDSGQSGYISVSLDGQPTQVCSVRHTSRWSD